LELIEKFSKTINGIDYIKIEKTLIKNDKAVKYENEYWSSGMPCNLIDKGEWKKIKET